MREEEQEQPSQVELEELVDPVEVVQQHLIQESVVMQPITEELVVQVHLVLLVDLDFRELLSSLILKD